jgi:hypothetical protein
VCGDGLRTLLTPAVVADDDLNGSAVGGGLQSLLLARRARDSTPALAPGTPNVGVVLDTVCADRW